MVFPTRKALAVALLAAFCVLLLGVPVIQMGRAPPDPGLTADIVYRSTTGSNGLGAPSLRSGLISWSSGAEQPDSGSPIRAVRIAQSPTVASERIFVAQGDDGWLDAYACSASCAVTNDVGQVWASAPGTLQRRFDIAYEQGSGQALLVYGALSMSGTEDLAYRTYGDGAWSPERFLDDPDHDLNVQYSLVRLTPRWGSDQIGLLGGDSTNNHVNAWIWGGDAFGSFTEITSSAMSPNRDRAALAWETGSGHLLATAADGNAGDEIVWKEFTTEWSSAANHVCGSSGNILRWLSLRPNPASGANDIVLAAGDDASALGTCYWNGSAWEARVSQDSSVDGTATRPFDFAWEPSGNTGLLVYGTAAGEITYRTFSAPATWSDATSVAMGTAAHAWVQLRTNPFPGAASPTIVGAILEDATNALGCIAWGASGLRVLGVDTFTSDAGSAAYETFDLAFRVASTPGTGTNPGGENPFNLPFALPFGLKFDWMFFLILFIISASVAGVAVARRRRRRNAPGNSRRVPESDPQFPTADPDPPALEPWEPRQLAPEPEQQQ